NPDLSDGFCLVLSRMIARDAQDRYPSLKDAAADMEALRVGRSVSCKPLPPDRYNFLTSAAKTGSKNEPIPAEDSSTMIAASATETSAAPAVSRLQKPLHARVADRQTGQASRKSVNPAPAKRSWTLQAGIAAAGVLLLSGIWLAMGDSKPKPTKVSKESATT